VVQGGSEVLQHIGGYGCNMERYFPYLNQIINPLSGYKVLSYTDFVGLSFVERFIALPKCFKW
jgi:hypothetical protein